MFFRHIVLIISFLLSCCSIMGGLGAIPLFSWWPIKAYRPCPNFIERGGQYVR